MRLSSIFELDEHFKKLDKKGPLALSPKSNFTLFYSSSPL